MSGDTAYLEGAPGILRLIEIAISIACIVCTGMITKFTANKELAEYRSALYSGSAFIFVAGSSIIWMTTMLILFVFQLESSTNLKTPDMVMCVIWGILYLIISIIETIYTWRTVIRFRSQVAACVLGFAIVIVLFVHVYFLSQTESH